MRECPADAEQTNVGERKEKRKVVSDPFSTGVTLF